MTRFSALALALFLCLLTSCDQPVICTEEFRFVSITVVGDRLNDFYTIRESNEEVIRFQTENNRPQVWYPVLDDSYREMLEGKQETFFFVGILNGREVIREEFEIKADACHIGLVKGPSSITLPQ